MPAHEAGTDQSFAPVENRILTAVMPGHLRWAGLDLMLTFPAPIDAS
jgi:hypothetical protein